MADVLENVVVVVDKAVVLSVCAPGEEDTLHNDAEEEQHCHHNPHCASLSVYLRLGDPVIGHWF